jgi:hypothetical protein
MSTPMKSFKLADSVWHRVVQCVQEGLLTGTDVSDSLRQVRVVPDETDDHVLVLSADYQQQVREMHEKLLNEARAIQSQQAVHKFIVPGGDGSDTN